MSSSPESRLRQNPAPSFQSTCTIGIRRPIAVNVKLKPSHRKQCIRVNSKIRFPNSTISFISCVWLHELKIWFPKYDSDAPRSGRRETPATISYIVVGIFAGASGTYFLERGFHVSVAALLGIAGVVVGIAISVALRCGKLDRARPERTSNKMPQTTVRWDYRPRSRIQSDAQNQGAETFDVLSVSGSATDIDESVWFDFSSVDSAAPDAPMNSPAQKPYD